MLNLYLLFYIYLAELVDINTLLKINPSEISMLVKQFPLGIQINFRYNVEIWQKSYTKLNEPNINMPSLILPSPSCSSALENVSSAQNQSMIQPQCIPSKLENFELCNILDSTQGALIVGYYKSHNSLNHNIRTLLVELITQELIKNNNINVCGIGRKYCKPITATFPI